MKEMGGGVEPQAIFTDADLAAECAMNQVFPNSDKYRCLLQYTLASERWYALVHFALLMFKHAARAHTRLAHLFKHAARTHTRLTHFCCRVAPQCRCYWHLEQNIIKNLKGALGHDFDSLISNFKAAAFATSQRKMRAKWERVMQAGGVVCAMVLCASVCVTVCVLLCATNAAVHVRQCGSLTGNFDVHLTAPPIGRWRGRVI